MDRKSLPALRLTPGSSPTLAAFILLTHMSASAVLLLLPESPAWRILLGVPILFSLVHVWRTHIRRRGPGALIAAEWDAFGQWRVQLPGGELCPARLHDSSYVQPWLVILNFVLENGGRRSLVLPPDALEAEQLRRLRVRLRLSGTQDTDRRSGGR